MRILLCLVLLMPILGVLGVFPPPTADLYSPEGWAFMQALMKSDYMMPLIGLLAAVCFVLVAVNRTEIAAVLLAPFVVNVLCFHLFVDGSFFTLSASLAWVLNIATAYFLWINRKKYAALW